MEINKKTSSFWNSSSDEQLQLDSIHFEKSYECSFCDRSFSNAQALGGHMNIHRKERAKLKQFSEKDDDDDDDQSCHAYADDINQSNNAGRNFSSLTYTTTSEKLCNLSRQLTNPSSSRTADEVNPRVKGPINDELLNLLPLSSKTQPTTENRSPADHGDKTASSVDEPFPNLDLELRLGPEPARHGNRSSKAI